MPSACRWRGFLPNMHREYRTGRQRTRLYNETVGWVEPCAAREAHRERMVGLVCCAHFDPPYEKWVEPCAAREAHRERMVGLVCCAHFDPPYEKWVEPCAAREAHRERMVGLVCCA